MPTLRVPVLPIENGSVKPCGALFIAIIVGVKNTPPIHLEIFGTVAGKNIAALLLAVLLPAVYASLVTLLPMSV
jgi:hypothetical protein